MRNIILILCLFMLPACRGADTLAIIKPYEGVAQQHIYGPAFSQIPGSRHGISLALSGGGARGLAQIGVLEVFEENNIPIRFIAATSMGSIIGGLYCAGYSPAELRKIAIQTDWRELFSSSPLRSSILVSARGRPEKALVKIGFARGKPVLPKGITSGQKLSNLLTDLAYRPGIKSTISFDLLDPPFRATATDLISGKTEIIASGDLAEALRASMSFPIGFTPVLSGNKLLVDGGLLNPIPVDICLNLAGRPVVAINTTTTLLPADSVADAIDMINQSTTVMTLDKLNQQLDLADIVIAPDPGMIKTFDFGNIELIIESGRTAALAALPDIKRLLEGTNDDNAKMYTIDNTIINGLKNIPEAYFEFLKTNDNQISKSVIQARLQEAFDTGNLKDASATIYSENGRVILEYNMTEHNFVSDIGFIGVTLFSPQTLAMNIKSRAGKVINIKTLTEDEKAIESVYAASGYTLAGADVIIGGSDSSEITFIISEGIIDDVFLEGNKRTRDFIILRDLHIKSGQKFRSTKARQSLNDLYGTGLFSTIKLLAQPDSQKIDLTVKVEEKSYDFLRLGLRYDNEYKSAGFIDLVGSNLFGAGHEIAVSGQFGESKRTVGINLKADRILNTYLTYRIGIDYEEFERNWIADHESIGNISEESTGLAFELGQQIPRLGKLSLVLNISRHLNQDPVTFETQDMRRSSLSLISIVDTFNSLPIPERGKLHYFEFEYANDFLGGDMIYTRFYTSIEAYYPLGRGLNFHPKAEVGVLNRKPPYFKQFFLGGRNSFYGLFSHELAGEKIFNGSFELRQSLTDYLYYSIRYDFGEVWTKIQSIRFDELQHGFGTALTARTIVGPIGIAVGRTTEGYQALYFWAGYEY